MWQLLLCLFPFEYDFWPRINVSANITATGLSRGSTRISLARAEQTRQDTLRYALNINQVNFLRQRIQFLGKRLTGDCQRCPDGQQHNSDTNSSNSNNENNKQLVTRLNFSIHFAPRHTLRMRNATDTFSASLLIIRSPFAQRHLITLYVRLFVYVRVSTNGCKLPLTCSNSVATRQALRTFDSSAKFLQVPACRMPLAT